MNIPGTKIRLEGADIAFILILVISLFLNFSLISELKQMPSPLYGGDLYNGLGGVNHILSGGNVLESAQMVGEPPWVPWGYHLSVAAFSVATGLDALHALMYFSLVVQFFSLIVVYLLAARVAGNRNVALIASVLVDLSFPVFKYSDVATVLAVPLFALMLAQFMEKPGRRSAALAGIAMGIMGLSNTQAFFVGIIMFGFAAICLLYPRIREKGLKLEAVLEEKELVTNLGILFLVGFVLALLFWFKPIFVFHGQTPNDIQNITYPDVTQMGIFMGQTYGFFVSLLAPFGFDFPGIVFSALNVAGLYFVLRNPGRYGIAVVLVATALAGILHPVITEPLLKTQFMALMMFGRVSLITGLLLVSIGFSNLAERIKNGKAALAALAVCILLAGLMVNNYLSVRSNDQWVKVGKDPLPPFYAELEGWIKENTNVNDVFLTTNEDGFMMNSLTGRKVVSYRRAHSSPYTDMHARMADQAVMAYGTNGQKTSELLEKYDVKYLLVTYNWVSNEFRVSDQGQLAGFFDPLDVPNNATNKAYWDANGVKYLQATMSMDPAPPANVPLYDMIVALPYPIQNGGPISPTLMGHFRLVKAIKAEGADIFQIYERVD